MLTATIVDAWLKMMTLSLHVTINQTLSRFLWYLLYTRKHSHCRTTVQQEQDNKKEKVDSNRAEERRNGANKQKKMYRLKQLKMRGMPLFTWSLMHLQGVEVIKIICNQSPNTAPFLLLLLYSHFPCPFINTPTLPPPPFPSPAMFLWIALTTELLIMIITSFCLLCCVATVQSQCISLQTCSLKLTVTLSWLTNPPTDSGELSIILAASTHVGQLGADFFI